jgi:23S rRNA (uracil1939-C5)-methyltransferase
LQALPYEGECQFKGNKIQQALGRIGGFRDYDWRGVVPSSQEYGYRNKIDLSVHGQDIGYQDDGRIVPIQDCLLADDRLRETLDFFKYWIRTRLPARHGLDRLILRVASHEPAVNVLLRGFLTQADLALLVPACREHPLIRGLAYQERPGRPWHQLLGDGHLTHTLSGVDHRVLHNGFFQVNHGQAETLVQACLDWVAEESASSLLDLFCGVGAFTYPLSRVSTRVLGVDSAQSERPRQMGSVPVRFLTWDLGQGLPPSTLSETWDTVLLDPPRAGIRPQLAQEVRVGLQPRRILYISCNPSTLSRDCKQLCADGAYALERVQGFDLFPRTTHVESMVLLRRKTAITRGKSPAR